MSIPSVTTLYEYHITDFEDDVVADVTADDDLDGGTTSVVT